MSVLDKANNKKLCKAAQAYEILWKLYNTYSLSSHRYQGTLWNIKQYEQHTR